MTTALRSFLHHVRHLRRGNAGLGRCRSGRRQLVDGFRSARDLRRSGSSGYWPASTAPPPWVVATTPSCCCSHGWDCVSSEVAFLELDDIDWRTATLNVRTKGGMRNDFPLSHEVGEALAHYLRHGRPSSHSRRVFLRVRAPIGGFRGPCGVGSVIRHALERAGIDAPTRGAHQFRHGLSTEMMRQGASLGEIGDVLGHRHPDTTRIYAQRGPGGAAPPGPAVAQRRCAMNTLREAVDEYLSMRRHLGFKLHRGRSRLARLRHVPGAAPGSRSSPKRWRLPGRSSPCIVQPVTIGPRRLSFVRGSSRDHRQCDRPAHRGPVPGIAAVSAQAGQAVSVLR